ncbi:MAG TPA: family 78 glycoside hydrolase catalytic domain [Kribbella sp.]
MSTIHRRTVLGGVAGAAAMSGVQVGAWATPEGRGGLRPVGLTTEHLTDPLGIDTLAPRFGWRLTTDGPGRAQSAYRILVATSPRLLAHGTADVWDSGRVRSGEQSAQVYTGPPLRARTQYAWAVRVWDQDGKPGPLSEAGRFETAMLSTRDWVADWVGSGVVIPPPVRVLPPGRYQPTALLPGQTLGQSFVSADRIVGVVVLLEVPPGQTASCTLTLRRSGPDGALVARGQATGLLGDKFGNAQGRLDVAETAPPGAYYLELSTSRGSVGWVGASKNTYTGGFAFANGDAVKTADRWLCGIPPQPPANPLLRTEFLVPGQVGSARLYLAGLGRATAWINGRRVGDAVLSPVATDFDKRLLYTTHDVTALLRSGANAIGVALGRGHFATRAPDSDGTNLAAWVAEPQLRAQLEITLRGGRRITVCTDTAWRHTDGPTTYEGVLAGESYDAQRAYQLSGWSSTGFDAGDWRPVTTVAAPGGWLEAYPGEHIRTGKPIPPVRVTSPTTRVRVYDFGVNVTGWARLRGQLPAGTTVRLQYGEKLDSAGRVDVGTPGGVENPAIDGRFQVDEFTADGRGMQSWEPSFSYKGFRYVEVTGTAATLNLLAVPVHSDLAVTMDLKLGNPTLQWIADAFRRTAENGLHGYPDVSPLTKVGWLGGARNSAQPMLYQFGMARLFDHWLEDIRLSQGPSGEIPIIAPLGPGPIGFLMSPVYTSLYPHLVRRYWTAYGDRTVPERHFDAVRRSIDWVLSQVPNDIADDTFGDWYPPGVALGEHPRGKEGGRLVGTAYVIESLRDAIALADLLRRYDHARVWRTRFDRMVRRFTETFLAAGTYRTDAEVGYRQTSNALPLAFGLVPAAQVHRVAAGLADDVEARNGHLDTGSMGTGALPYALSDHGRPDLAVAVLAQNTYPSYGYLRRLGASTFWESWEEHSRGHNDPTLSAAVDWLVERAVGLESLRPGWARFRVAPAVTGSLPSASITLDTVRGRIEAGWRRDGQHLLVAVLVPVNSRAELVLPDGETRELAPGRHRIRSRISPAAQR